MNLKWLNRACFGDYLLTTVTGEHYFLHLAHERNYLCDVEELNKPIEEQQLKPIYSIERLRVGARALFIFMPKSRGEKLAIWPTEKISTITNYVQSGLEARS
ncbi:hypothetical protein [Lapidilactobacillus wuchangensis]|uniref:hypothetical protein n=1 Tax=Lapidilactobacillus wuchangensis TaxID=2486001 RepID=UPI000F7B95E7|nr:hypothetical protein [Lapidilactobacillus wuchangensis]